jgi:hypothetical protein
MQAKRNALEAIGQRSGQPAVSKSAAEIESPDQLPTTNVQ